MALMDRLDEQERDRVADKLAQRSAPPSAKRTNPSSTLWREKTALLQGIDRKLEGIEAVQLRIEAKLEPRR